jgi:hypothetical protein
VDLAARTDRVGSAELVRSTRGIGSAGCIDACHHDLIDTSARLVVTIAEHMKRSLILSIHNDWIDLVQRTIAVNTALPSCSRLDKGSVH